MKAMQKKQELQDEEMPKEEKCENGHKIFCLW
jgi:hypothetical protein